MGGQGSGTWDHGGVRVDGGFIFGAGGYFDVDDLQLRTDETIRSLWIFCFSIVW